MATSADCSSISETMSRMMGQRTMNREHGRVVAAGSPAEEPANGTRLGRQLGDELVAAAG